jgi:tetratricopeptide (TPR) repeat protein
MTLEIGWKKLLEDNFHLFEPESELELDDVLAIDLDGDGLIESHEIIDDFTSDSRHSAYYVDEDEAGKFCLRNWDTLAEKISFLKYAVDLELRRDNPIHSLILYESQLLAPYYKGSDYVDALVEKAYSEFVAMRNAVIALEIQFQFFAQRPSTPLDQMIWINEAMINTGVMFALGGSLLFIENMATEKKIFNCLSTFAALGIGHEMDWPVRAVMVPHHIFMRWIDETNGDYINFEVQNRNSYNDDFYIWLRNGETRPNRAGTPRINEISIEGGTYLKTLDNEELESLFFYNIGQALATNTDFFGRRFEDAVSAYTNSIDLYPQNAFAYAARALAYMEFEMQNEAMADFTRARDLDPNLGTAYEGIGLIQLRTGDFEEAIENLTTAISLEETPSAYINRAIASSRLSQMREGDEARRLLRQAERDNRRAAELTEK